MENIGIKRSWWLER